MENSTRELLTSTHWGTYVVDTIDGRVSALRGFDHDPDPSPIGPGIVDVLEGPHKGRHAGVASLGERPTFGVNAPNFEVHLFDFSGDLYGTEISVGLVKYLRGEEKFDGIDALITQMDQDSALARETLEITQVPEWST